jgi:hypothetical protein
MAENYLESIRRKGKAKSTTSSKNSGKLTKDGLVYKNDLLMTDYTSGMRVNRKPQKTRM